MPQKGLAISARHCSHYLCSRALHSSNLTHQPLLPEVSTGDVASRVLSWLGYYADSSKTWLGPGSSWRSQDQARLARSRPTELAPGQTVSNYHFLFVGPFSNVTIIFKLVDFKPNYFKLSVAVDLYGFLFIAFTLQTQPWILKRACSHLNPMSPVTQRFWKFEPLPVHIGPSLRDSSL